MGDENLLQIARSTPTNWRPGELCKLLESFGFECWDGKRHLVCRHTQYRNVYHTIPRHRPVRPYLVRAAVKLIERVQQLDAQEVADE